MISLTLSIIIITCIISIPAFGSEKMINDLIFYPPAVSKRMQYYRFITCGLIHADFMHLGFNMFSLYLFGDLVEERFLVLFGNLGRLLYLGMYVSALVVCLLPTYFRNINNYHYKSLGASGAVSAVVFAGIFLYPTAKIGMFFIPPIIPGFIFAPIYLLVSAYLGKKGGDNINHSAHIWGSIYGVIFLIAASYIFSNGEVVTDFVDAIKGFFNL
jgi:membrane associated rhomboid family serine protease